MTSGVFSAAFMSNLNSGGSGVAIFSGNTIHGGDASHYYKGKYRFDAHNQISGTIDVVKYSPVQNSVFGPIASFRLKLDGHIIVNERAFSSQATLKGSPNCKSKLRSTSLTT